jgi:hypothetical protein
MSIKINIKNYLPGIFGLGGGKDQLSQLSESELAKLDAEIAADQKKFSPNQEVSPELSQETQSNILEARSKNPIIPNEDSNPRDLVSKHFGTKKELLAKLAAQKNK